MIYLTTIAISAALLLLMLYIFRMNLSRGFNRASLIMCFLHAIWMGMAIGIYGIETYLK